MITTFMGPTAVYFAVRRWLHQRQAWQWWHKQQTARLHEQAESIRDDLLQQTFAFRRYLESTLATQPDTDQTQQWLERFQIFYASLERLSNQLSPPFLADSLPLALQFMIQNWQYTHPDLTVDFRAPSDWSEKSAYNNQIILSVLTGLIELLVPIENSKQVLHIVLKRQEKLCVLTVSIPGHQPQSGQPFTSRPEVKHLKKIFSSLIAGRLEIVTEASGLTGQLYWQDN